MEILLVILHMHSRCVPGPSWGEGDEASYIKDNVIFVPTNNMAIIIIRY